MLKSRAWDVAMQLIKAEEEKVTPVQPSTHTHERVNLAINARTSLFSCDWKGIVKELTLKADGNDFRVRVTNDVGEVYNLPYSWFVSHGDEIEGVSAFEDNGTYVLHIIGIKFDGLFRFEVIPVTAFNATLFTINIERVLE